MPAGMLSLDLDLRGAVELYLFLGSAPAELPSSLSALHGELRSYLYDNLSIEDLERPQELLDRLSRPVS